MQYERRAKEYIEANPDVFYAIFALVLVFNLVGFYVGGRKAERPFREAAPRTFRFRERGASGHSKTSLVNRFGGARGALDVAVTESELWIKGIYPMFTYIGSKFDMTLKVPLSNIVRVKETGRNVEVWLRKPDTETSHIELELKDVGSFLKALSPNYALERTDEG
jgi:hypothetical protein